NWLIFYHWPMSDMKHHVTWNTAHTPPTAPVPPAPGVGASTAVPMASAPPAAPSQTVPVGQMQHDEENMTPLQSIADTSVNGYFFFVAWAALYLALCYAAEVGALERRTAKLRAATQAAELRALRYQVNPHFLFNTLNSLSSLVLTGKRDEAERMIINLSTFFRTSLTGDPSDDVPLSEEIFLQRLYLDIETVRFPERLVVDIDVPETLRDACVPGLILQPLVENAVKYGVSRAKRPVTIRIRATEQSAGLALVVEDDGNPAPIMNGHDAGTGVGLQNVRDRLIARFGDAGDCRWSTKPGGGFAVTLTMPLVRNACC
ncbi:MAG TPA: histidine kinase, partial [Sphingomonas sp.]|nr:histidine kinase [Sphingomonas sp.]